MMTNAQLATLSCQRRPKKELCKCSPCNARRHIFGDNIPVQKQELRREARDLTKDPPLC